MSELPLLSQLDSIPFWSDHILCVHSSTAGHMDCPRLLSNVNNIARSKQVHVFAWIAVFSYLGYIPSSGISGDVVIPCLTFEKAPTPFPSGCITSHCHQPFTGVPILRQPRPSLIFCFCSPPPVRAVLLGIFHFKAKKK